MDWVNYLYFPCENAPCPSALVEAARSVGFSVEDPVTGRIRAARFNVETLDFDPFEVATVAELDASGAEPNLTITLFRDGGPIRLHIDPRHIYTATVPEPKGLSELPCLGHIWFSLGVLSMRADPGQSGLPRALIDLYATLCRQTDALYGYSDRQIAEETGPTAVAALRAIQAGRAPDGLYWMTYFGGAIAAKLDFAPLRALGALVEPSGAGVLVRLTEHPRGDVTVDPRRIYAVWQNHEPRTEP